MNRRNNMDRLIRGHIRRNKAISRLNEGRVWLRKGGKTNLAYAATWWLVKIAAMPVVEEVRVWP